ncbi:hypothetical protein SPRG_03295 [Saprolegnia parasitica CBS 223.65]|uniref:PX domain-containing protein n=1 Tax=Saprolegnia parasitica (strain CBS 223.65) TaxID=695850 RepID=A0A067CZY3_SAPPC|nr:hypothetical protein SPRG_03295 [Saprolegnia parasitica CBS 223.65]KDO32076.1 hypothetical protein SPRG_03295 [Saprolegnia parasitica CBS 223.65]|eukprot:XP_012197264.1 hypothetical protein SPRG_03295 [Saprolegnia parasitica CBS 223.65]
MLSTGGVRMNPFLQATTTVVKPVLASPTARPPTEKVRRSSSAPVDSDGALSDTDRRVQRAVNSIRSSLNEIYTDLHANVVDEPTTDVDDGGWGWFEDIDEDNQLQANSVAPFGASDLQSLLYSGGIDGKRDVFKTFEPLSSLLYETPFGECAFPWMRLLSPHRPLGAKITLRSFRIVEMPDGSDRHAEYCIQYCLGDATHTVWKRYAAFKRFVNTLKINGNRRSLRAWKDVLDRSSWFRSLDIKYLHQMCCLLETFVQVLLLEAPTPYHVARLLAAE